MRHVPPGSSADPHSTASADGDRTVMLRAAEQVEAAHQQIHQLQQRLSRRIERLRVHEPTAVTGGLYLDYSRIDGCIEQVKEGMDVLHAHLVAPGTP